MEFSYRVSEKDYVRAWRMAVKSRKSSIFKTIFFWAFIIVVLVLLFGVIEKTRTQHNQEQREPLDTEQTESAVAPVPASSAIGNIAKNVAPLALIGVIWIGLIFYWIPQKVRNQYRKDTNCHGEIRIALDPFSIAIRSSIGTSFQSGWSAFTNWSEKQDIVLLRFPSGTFHIINVAGLSEVQRDELHVILTAALPKA
jgi:hypothetical protein